MVRYAKKGMQRKLNLYANPSQVICTDTLHLKYLQLFAIFYWCQFSKMANTCQSQLNGTSLMLHFSFTVVILTLKV